MAISKLFFLCNFKAETDRVESKTTVQIRIIRVKEQFITIIDIMEKVDVEGAQGKTDGMIENQVAEVCSMCFVGRMACFFSTETLFFFSGTEIS